MNKLCTDCGSSEVYEEGIYCNTLNKFVGRCSEQRCLLKDHEEYEYNEGYQQGRADRDTINNK